MIDRILATVAPGLAAARAEARLRMARADTARSVLMSYDSAQTGGRHAGFRRKHTSADAEIGPALPMLRASAREIVRNNPHANRAVRVLSSHIAGAGVKPRPKAGGDDAARDIWARFVDDCDVEGRLDFWGQQRLIARTVVESGEALRLWQPKESRGKLVWRCRVLEGDYLDNAKCETREDGSRIVQGVEFDWLGQRVAYWLFDHHPGDRGPWGGSWSSRRVPAAQVDHIFETLRPEQSRGVSWFAPVTMTLRDLGDLAEAELVRKKLEACIAMVISSGAVDEDTPAVGAATVGENGSGAPITDAAGRMVERLGPGLILQAREGWSADFMAPKASEGLADHMRERLHAVAAGCGITYHQLTGDLSQANYSSLRGGMVEFHRLLDSWQDELMIRQSGGPAWRRVMDAAVTSREIGAAPAAQWTRPARPWVDPAKDMAAKETAMRLRLQSPQNVIEEMGHEPEEIVREWREWGELLAREGVPPAEGAKAATPVAPAPGRNDTKSEG